MFTQTIGRAARNDRGKVIMYADRMTDSMQRTINETDRRREKQIAYNTLHGITPKTIKRSREEILKQTELADARTILAPEPKAYVEPEELNLAADPILEYLSKPKLDKMIAETQKRMQKAAKDMDFMEAARLRDEMFALQKKLEEVG